jgi:hypothetical protein
MTIKEIIKILPMSEKQRMEILNTYDFMDVGERVMIDRLAWDTYYSLYTERLNTNLAEQKEKVEEGKEELGTDFYQRALKKTDQEMTGEMKEALGEADLASARQAVQRIIQEMQDAKKSKKPR